MRTKLLAAAAAAVAGSLVLPAMGQVRADEPIVLDPIVVPPPAEAGLTTLVFNGEDNRLNVYEAATGAKRTLIFSDADGARGETVDGTPVRPGALVRDLNAQICAHRFAGDTYFIAGEDTKQGDQSQQAEGKAGWGWFRLEGDTFDTLEATQHGKLEPVYQADANKNENYGCGFLDDGRLLLSDVGNQQPHQPADGQLHIWFPDPVEGFGAGYDFATDGFKAESDVPYCLLDRRIGTAGGIWPSGANEALVASARPGLNTELWGIFKYSNLPTSTDECVDTDGDGALEATGVTKELFIFDPVSSPTPNAVVATPWGTWIVSSVFSGTITEYDADGLFVRRLLAPKPGEVLPPYPSTGTPLGIGLTPAGEVWFADIGIVVEDPRAIGPGRNNGSVRKVVLGDDDGNPLTPIEPLTVDHPLAFPDGIGVAVVPLHPSGA